MSRFASGPQGVYTEVQRVPRHDKEDNMEQRVKDLLSTFRAAPVNRVSVRAQICEEVEAMGKEHDRLAKILGVSPNTPLSGLVSEVALAVASGSLRVRAEQISQEISRVAHRQSGLDPFTLGWVHGVIFFLDES